MFLRSTVRRMDDASFMSCPRLSARQLDDPEQLDRSANFGDYLRYDDFAECLQPLLLLVSLRGKDVVV